MCLAEVGRPMEPAGSAPLSSASERRADGETIALQNHSQLTNFIWAIADLLRGNYKQSEYGRVILPLTVIRRLDAVLAPTKAKVLSEYERFRDKLDGSPLEGMLNRAAGQTFHNISKHDFESLVADAPSIDVNLRAYLNGFSTNTREMLQHFRFTEHIERMHRAGILYEVMRRFNQADLHPDRVSNIQMGYVYEELVRRFSEQSNETAGEHFTPREVIELMVNLLFAPDGHVLGGRSAIVDLYDPACGTGGMLSVAENHLRNLNGAIKLTVYGQELNPETYATCVADMLLKGQDADNIVFGNTFTDDGLSERRFDYMLTNPPFGVDWKGYRRQVEDEHNQRGWQGRFGAGLPRVSDGSLLFLQHMLARMKAPQQGGSRLAIVFNASPLFTGAAGSGESEIRRWIIESDWLEAIVALPDQLFYNTGISTYVWVLTNRKSPERKGKVQLVDARGLSQKMRKSLGDKRNELSAEHIDEITRIYDDFAETDRSKIFPNEHFGFRRITVERPLRDTPDGDPILDAKGNERPDPGLRDYENVPLSESIESYMHREVLPHVPDAWVDDKKTKTGYEIPFTREFYVYSPPRPVEEIDAEIEALEAEILELLGEVRG